MNGTIRSEVLDLMKKGESAAPTVITEASLTGLPEPVQRYLRYTQVIGKETIRAVRLKQKGFFRTKENQRWMPLVAEQYFTTTPPAFLWYGTIRPFPFVSITGRDIFSDGHGNMVIKLMSFIKLADARGPEVDQGELLRYLGEMVWFPTVYLADYIRWEAIDARSATATIQHQGITASATLSFDDDGKVTQLIAERPREENGRFVLRQWAGFMTDYREADGRWIPAKLEAVWKLPSGDFSYFRGEVVEIEYNQASLY